MSHCVSSSAVAQKVCDAFSRDSSRARSAIVAQGMSFLFSVGECCLSLVVERSGFFISLTKDVIYGLSCLKQLSQASIGAGADLKRKGEVIYFILQKAYCLLPWDGYERL